MSRPCLRLCGVVLRLALDHDHAVGDSGRTLGRVHGERALLTGVVAGLGDLRGLGPDVAHDALVVGRGRLEVTDAETGAEGLADRQVLDRNGEGLLVVARVATGGDVLIEDGEDGGGTGVTHVSGCFLVWVPPAFLVEFGLLVVGLRVIYTRPGEYVKHLLL